MNRDFETYRAWAFLVRRDAHRWLRMTGPGYFFHTEMQRALRLWKQAKQHARKDAA